VLRTPPTPTPTPSVTPSLTSLGHADPDPIGHALSDPLGHADPDPIGHALSDPLGHADPEPLGHADPDPIAHPLPDPDAHTDPDPITHPLPNPITHPLPIAIGHTHYTANAAVTAAGLPAAGDEVKGGKSTFPCVFVSSSPLPPFSHKGRRGRLGILKPETGERTQGLSKQPNLPVSRRAHREICAGCAGVSPACVLKGRVPGRNARVFPCVFVPSSPLPPFSHKGRRGRLGILKPETSEGMQGLPKEPAPWKRLRGVGGDRRGHMIVE
jgi:hypothetical protein